LPETVFGKNVDDTEVVSEKKMLMSLHFYSMQKISEERKKGKVAEVVKALIFFAKLLCKKNNLRESQTFCC
jgi:hypothetical protein